MSRQVSRLLAAVLGGLQALPSAACMQTVTKYRTVPEQTMVTRHREVRKPVTKEVEVPYEEEVRTPEYKVVRAPRIKAGDKPLSIAVLPLTSSAGVEVGESLSRRLELLVASHEGSASSYRVVSQDALRRALGRPSLGRLSAAEFRRLAGDAGVEVFVAGHVSAWSDAGAAVRLEAVDAATLRPRFTESLSGTPDDVEQQAVAVFFGRSIQTGVKLEKVTKYRTETRTEWVTVQEPYQEPVTTERQEAYEEQEIDLLGTLLLGGLIVLLGGGGSKAGGK